MHPLQEGGGHCETDSDCENPGWLICGDNLCLNPTYFPRNVFIRNSENWYTSSDNCCYRRCNKRYYLCGQNEVGCLESEDCKTGYHCNKNTAQPYCTDINECAYRNGHFEGLLYCGIHTDCTNSVGSFSCTCKTGFTEFVEFGGCRDKNECIEGGHNCATNADCWNTIGSFVCTCKVGYTGNPISKCYDLDECSLPEWNSCTVGSLGINTETTYGNDLKEFEDLGPYEIGDGKEHIFRFDIAASGPSDIFLYRKEPSVHYLISINLNGQVTLKRGQASSYTLLKDKTKSELKLVSSQFKSYFIRFKLNGNNEMTMRFGTNNDFIYAADSEFGSDPFSIDTLKLSTSWNGNTFWRNIKKDEPSQTCMNTVGSYICLNNDEDRVAIGFGGHTTSGSVYPNEFTVVTKDKYACSGHTIGNLAGRYAAGMAAIDDTLYVCGGWYSGANTALIDCKKLSLNDPQNGWSSAPDLPQKRRHFMMVTFKSSMYVVGGQDVWNGGSDCINGFHEFNENSNSWSAKATMPYKNHRQCAVSDEQGDRIYMIGGHTCHVGDRKEVYYYTVSSNTWTKHSDLIGGQAVIDPACGIIELSTGERWLLVVKGSRTEAVIYYDLTNSVGWTHVANLRHNYKQNYMKMVMLDKYSALLLGSGSQQFSNSLSNFWEYNSQRNTFEEGYYYLQNEMRVSHWATVNRSRNHAALANCVTMRKYAVVGWGGYTSSSSDYPPHWSIMLRDRLTTSSLPHKPASCHRKIPDLSPGKLVPGVTAVDYRLMVCGGYQYGKTYEANCHWLDTNQESPTWASMASMPVPRGYFELVTYADAAYAIGGYYSSSYRSRVDRWTLKEGWQEVAKYPVKIGRHCAVADEGYDKIYSMGGRYMTSSTGSSEYNRAYVYDVKSNVWSSMPGDSTLYHGATQDGACMIIRRRSNGHRILVYVGDYQSRTQYFDLSGYEASGSGSWRNYKTPQYKTKFSTIVSLSPYESYQVCFYIYQPLFFTHMGAKV